MRVFHPISVDRYGNAISTLLREIAIHNESMEFHSFSRPDGAVDAAVVEAFWRLPQMRRAGVFWWLRPGWEIGHVASATWRNVAMLRWARLAGGGRMRIVYTANVEPHDYDIKHLRWMEWLVRNCDFLACVSTAVAEAVKARWGRTADAIVPNGADPAFFRADAVTVSPPERPLFLYLGTVTGRKRPEVFIEMARRIPEADFRLLGPPGFGDEPTRYAEAAKGLANVFFMGGQSRAQVRDWLARCTALLFPSDLEGLPLSVIEAQMMGVPAVAQPVSCMPELVEEGVNGHLMPAADLAGWERICRRLMDSPRNVPGKPWRHEIARQAVARYSWEGIGRKYGDIYRSLVENTRPDPRSVP